MAANELTDNRIGKNTQHSLAALLRQSVYSRPAGYEDTNDAERLSIDPTMRYVTFQMAEVLVSKALFYEILAKIHSLKSIPIEYD